jgi:uncharacterized membrane protein
MATSIHITATYNSEAAQDTTGMSSETRDSYGYFLFSGATNMLWTITIILFILWVLGLVSSYTLGGWIHILLVLALIVLIFNLLSGRRAL